MAVETTDVQALLTKYADELNEAVERRSFEEFVPKWFAMGECSLTFRHESDSLDDAVRLWTHLLPKGEAVPRHVEHEIYRVEDGRVYTKRALKGGIVPKPLYGLQETQFDENLKIHEIVINSQQEEPPYSEDPEAANSRFGQAFKQFSKTFDRYFETGEARLLEEWCDPGIHMSIDSTFWNGGVIGSHHRLGHTARFRFEDIEEEKGENRYLARVYIEDWGGFYGHGWWDMTFTPEGKVKHVTIALDM